ncbi:MAG TPA: peptidylprolyl isomerase [Bryobacteraceae bacterium]|nr:peptidylprolyl isomerase [Bryobacteraceae bacterium]
MKPVCLLAVLAACAWPETQPDQPVGGPEAVAPGLYAIVKTSMGPITAKLFEKDAPSTVSTFVGLATGHQAWKDPETGEMVDRPLYSNLRFDRVAPGYMIQTGDPTSTGTYDCGIRVKDEVAPDLQFDRPGRLGIMNFGQPNTGTCEFFITADAYPALDAAPGSHGYTIFGQVIDGQEIVDRISNVPHDAHGRPRTAVRLLGVVIQRVGPGAVTPAPQPVAATTRKKPKID